MLQLVSSADTKITASHCRIVMSRGVASTSSLPSRQASTAGNRSLANRWQAGCWRSNRAPVGALAADGAASCSSGVTHGAQLCHHLTPDIAAAVSGASSCASWRRIRGFSWPGSRFASADAQPVVHLLQFSHVSPSTFLQVHRVSATSFNASTHCRQC